MKAYYIKRKIFEEKGFLSTHEKIMWAKIMDTAYTSNEGIEEENTIVVYPLRRLTGEVNIF